MKPNFVLPFLALVIGVVLGIAMDRTIVTSKDSPSGPSSSSRGSSPVAADPASQTRSRTSAGGRFQFQQRDPAAAIRRIRDCMGSSPMATSDFGLMLEAYESIQWMSPEQIQLALEELDRGKPNSDESMTLRTMLMELWAKTDPRAALEHALASKSSIDQQLGVMGGIMNWMKYDPKGAQEWYHEHRDQFKGGYMDGAEFESAFIGALAQHDLAAAIQEMKQVDGLSGMIVEGSVLSRLAKDPVQREEFLQRIQQEPDDQFRVSKLQTLVSHWADEDPQAAARYLERCDKQSTDYKAMEKVLLSKWSDTDPIASITWKLGNLDAGIPAGDQIADGYGNWAIKEPDRALEWLNSQPDEVRTDSLHKSAAMKFAFAGNIAQATPMIERIGDQRLRLQALTVMHYNLQLKGASHVQQWMDGLSPALRAEVEALNKP